MKIRIALCCLVLLLAISCSENKEPSPWIISAPAGDRYVSIDKNGETIIPNGRIVAPTGKSIVVAPHPYGLTLSPDGNTAVTANSGTGPLSITIIRNIAVRHSRSAAGPPGSVHRPGCSGFSIYGIGYLQ